MPKKEYSDGLEELQTLGDVIRYFENLAESYPYLDDYDILVIEGSNKPIIIMSPEEMVALERKIVGR